MNNVIVRYLSRNDLVTGTFDCKSLGGLMEEGVTGRRGEDIDVEVVDIGSRESKEDLGYRSTCVCFTSEIQFQPLLLLSISRRTY